MNRLAQEKSAYLKHAADQKIDWYPWSEDAFQKARDEDKPLLLSSGAVWCHWCHVMAKESFYDDEVAQLLNDKFICIKIDRDERPYIDRRYQLAVSTMGGGGGWPLTVFLQPDKKPFYGGTYFPPEDRFGRPGLKKVLKSVSELYKDKRGEVAEYSEKVISAIKVESYGSGEISETQLDGAVQGMLAQFDDKHGGFGSVPKFPMPGALEFLIHRYSLTGSESIRHCVEKTLNSMGNGGMYDHIGDGFHRYSTDESWIIPHFEKMAEDNAWLLRNYLNAYMVFGDESYRKIAEGIVQFTNNVLSDPEGGFYISQDADLTPDDEGGYFTWTESDFRKVLNDEEYGILSQHLLSDSGAMHHDTEKKVLFIAKSAAEIASDTGNDLKYVEDIISTGKEKLLMERNTRETPFIDKTLYTSINGMYISVFFLAYRFLGDNKIKEFAVKSLDKIIRISRVNKELYHTADVRGLLDDYVCLADAMVSAYEATGEVSYLNAADDLMEECIRKFWDEAEGGFFDSDDHLLGVSIKGIQDVPHPSVNSICIILLLKLSAIIGNLNYHNYAEKALKVFSVSAQEMGVHSGYYYSALDAFYNSLKLNVNSPSDSDMSKTARSLFAPYLHIQYGEDRGHAIACFREACYEPFHDSESLKSFLTKKK